VDRRLAQRVEQIAARGAREAAEARRRVGHAETREPHLRDRHADRLGDDRERVQIRGLALVGGHAGRGVALDVLDRAEALARRERQIARRDVVLPIDEGLSARRRRPCGQRTEIGVAAAQRARRKAARGARAWGCRCRSGACGIAVA
jgi:hypothetical protein